MNLCAFNPILGDPECCRLRLKREGAFECFISVTGHHILSQSQNRGHRVFRHKFLKVGYSFGLCVDVGDGPALDNSHARHGSKAGPFWPGDGIRTSPFKENNKSGTVSGDNDALLVPLSDFLIAMRFFPDVLGGLRIAAGDAQDVELSIILTRAEQIFVQRRKNAVQFFFEGFVIANQTVDVYRLTDMF